MIKIKRITELTQKEDGFRIMVENICPERIDFENMDVDLWLKEIAPDTECYGCLGEDNSGFIEFKEKYRDKLRRKKTLLKIIKDIENEKGIITLLYCVDDENNCAAILKEKLEGYRVISKSIDRIHGG